jgi:hypothetical protein
LQEFNVNFSLFLYWVKHFTNDRNFTVVWVKLSKPICSHGTYDIRYYFCSKSITIKVQPKFQIFSIFKKNIKIFTVDENQTKWFSSSSHCHLYALLQCTFLLFFMNWLENAKFFFFFKLFQIGFNSFLTQFFLKYYKKLVFSLDSFTIYLANYYGYGERVSKIN